MSLFLHLALIGNVGEYKGCFQIFVDSVVQNIKQSIVFGKEISAQCEEEFHAGESRSRKAWVTLRAGEHSHFMWWLVSEISSQGGFWW